jgi:hypothetical protein
MLAANVSNKQSRVDDKGWSSSLRGGRGATNSSQYKLSSLLVPLVSTDSLVRHKRWKRAVHQLFIDFKKAYDSVRRKILYNILM